MVAAAPGTVFAQVREHSHLRHILAASIAHVVHYQAGRRSIIGAAVGARGNLAGRPRREEAELLQRGGIVRSLVTAYNVAIQVKFDGSIWEKAFEASYEGGRTN